jgi:hypothetical protein
MNARRLVCVPKTTTRVTEWGTGSIPRAQFPILQARLKVNPQWHWRAATLKSDIHEYRLLVQLRVDKPNQKAWLIVKFSEGWVMVARLESHFHSGLHCHTECVEGGLTIGEIDPSGMVALPYWKSFHRRGHGLKSPQEWWQVALKFFRAQTGGKGSLL